MNTVPNPEPLENVSRGYGLPEFLAMSATDLTLEAQRVIRFRGHCSPVIRLLLAPVAAEIRQALGERGLPIPTALEE